MPINDPIKRGKVAPGSLAFERRRSGGGAVISEGGDSYQTVINLTFSPRYNITVIDRESRDRDRKMHRVVTDSERRSKDSVGTWHRALEWDNASDSFSWSTNAGGINYLRWSNEIIRTMGAVKIGQTWRFRVPNDATGAWWFYAAWFGRFPQAAGIDAAGLYIYKNGAVYRLLDYVNHDMQDHSKLNEANLRGGTHIVLEPGDVVTFAVHLEGAAGTGSLSESAGSYYSYVTGHRSTCDREEWGGVNPGTNLDISPV